MNALACAQLALQMLTFQTGITIEMLFVRMFSTRFSFPTNERLRN